MIKAIEYNLQKAIKLLNSITNEQYSNASVAPYYSSIGSHIRHILDVFDCILEGVSSKKVNLVCRKRNLLVEKNISEGLQYITQILQQLKEINPDKLGEMIKVTDDLGLGLITANYTLESALIQAHSHAIHHFAIIGYIIYQLGVELPNADFGYNPTTPRD